MTREGLETAIYEGGCHCGAVRFQVIVKNHEALECNCSICSKKGFLHLIVDRSQFTLLKGQDVLTTYSFNTHRAKHTFCSICGSHPFYYPRSHPEGIDVNVRCLDGKVLSKFRIKFFDGENWEDNIEQIENKFS
jgi:hypothetical protein